LHLYYNFLKLAKKTAPSAVFKYRICIFFEQSPTASQSPSTAGGHITPPSSSKYYSKFRSCQRSYHPPVAIQTRNMLPPDGNHCEFIPVHDIGSTVHYRKRGGHWHPSISFTNIYLKILNNSQQCHLEPNHVEFTDCCQNYTPETSRQHNNIGYCW
jgi:hypothetical protein